jgi:hypothetical protein
MAWAKIFAVVMGLIRLGAGVFEYMNQPARRRAAAAKAIEKEAAERRAREQADEQAVREGDKDHVNGRLSDLLPLVVAGALLASGCATRTVYVPADREVVPIEHDGRAGWFVPNATLNDLLQAAQRARDLEREKAETARMEGTR